MSKKKHRKKGSNADNMGRAIRRATKPDVDRVLGAPVPGIGQQSRLEDVVPCRGTPERDTYNRRMQVGKPQKIKPKKLAKALTEELQRAQRRPVRKAQANPFGSTGDPNGVGPELYDEMEGILRGFLDPPANGWLDPTDRRRKKFAGRTVHDESTPSESVEKAVARKIVALDRANVIYKQIAAHVAEVGQVPANLDGSARKLEEYGQAMSHIKIRLALGGGL